MAGRADSSCKQRKTGSSRLGTPCCTYHYRMWIFQGASAWAHPVFCFAYKYGFIDMLLQIVFHNHLHR